MIGFWIAGVATVVAVVLALLSLGTLRKERLKSRSNSATPKSRGGIRSTGAAAIGAAIIGATAIVLAALIGTLHFGAAQQPQPHAFRKCTPIVIVTDPQFDSVIYNPAFINGYATLCSGTELWLGVSNSPDAAHISLIGPVTYFGNSGTWSSQAFVPYGFGVPVPVYIYTIVANTQSQGYLRLALQTRRVLSHLPNGAMITGLTQANLISDSGLLNCAT